MMAFTLLLLALMPLADAGQVAADGELRLLVSVEQPTIMAPFPARATLHLHNASQQTVWLYRRVRSRAKDGSALEVRLEPLEVKDLQVISTPAEGRVFENAGLPHPKLMKLAPEEDTAEKVTLKLLPAKMGEGEGNPVWGRYRLSVTYRAAFSNATEVARETNAALWRGETASNSIEIELKPPAGEGSIAGTVVNARGQPLRDAIVTLSDQEERPVDQMATESEGRFAFAPLPFGVYWVTVRHQYSAEDTTVFRHVTLTTGEPSGAVEFVLYPPDIYEARGLLHKPVLLLATDGQERPLDKVSYEIVWSTGKVLETIKGETGSDGTAIVELIPGRNFVTLKRRGCPKQEHRIEVEPGGGVDGFKLALECAQK